MTKINSALFVGFENTHAEHLLSELDRNNLLSGVEKSFMVKGTIHVGDCQIFNRQVNSEFLMNYQSTFSLDDFNLYTDNLLHEFGLTAVIHRHFYKSKFFDLDLIRLRLLSYVYDIIKSKKIDLLVFNIAPHQPAGYTAFIWGKKLGIPILILNNLAQLNAKVGCNDILGFNELVSSNWRDNDDSEEISMVIDNEIERVSNFDHNYMTKQHNLLNLLPKSLCCFVIIIT